MGYFNQKSYILDTFDGVSSARNYREEIQGTALSLYRPSGQASVAVLEHLTTKCFMLFLMSIASADTRERAIESYLKGRGTQDEIARSFGVTLRTFQRWLARYQQSGEISPQTRGHRQALFKGETLLHLDELVKQHPDATLEELRDMSGVDGSIMAVKRALDRLGYSFKKNAPRQRARA